MNRQKIANIIDRQSHTDWICTAYDWFMVLAILVSLLPLMFMKSHRAFWYTELGSLCRTARKSIHPSAYVPFLFRCPVLGNRNAHHRRLWRHVPRYRRRPLRKHALLPVWRRRNRAAFRRYNRPLSR